MATKDDVARWLYRKLMNDGELSNKQAVHQVQERFGAEFILTNEYGKTALDPDVLHAFRRYIHGKAEWDRDGLRWRRTRPVSSDDD